jgi:hypothetical protein
MNPESKFHLFVATSTLVVMYYIVTFGVPLLERHVPFPAITLPGLTALTSIGAYNFVAGLLRLIIAKSRLIKSWLLGNRYIEGTWIGKFHKDNVFIYTVEHFEQTLSTLKIRGEGYYESGKRYARWSSIAENIDELGGQVYFTYSCDRDEDKASFEGVAKFSFQRDDATASPDVISGYSADLIDGARTANTEKRISRGFILFKQALERAKNEA